MMGLASLITRDNAQIVMRNSLIYGSRLVIARAASWCLNEVTREVFNEFTSRNGYKIKLLKPEEVDRSVNVGDTLITEIFNRIFPTFYIIACVFFVDKFFESKTSFKYTSFTELTWVQVIGIIAIYSVVSVIFKNVMSIFKSILFNRNIKQDPYASRVKILSETIQLTECVFFGVIYSGNFDKSKVFGFIPAKWFIAGVKFIL